MKITSPLLSVPQINVPTLFMSDLHLNGTVRDQEVIRCLKYCLQTISPQVKHLMLVGDIFDFNLGYQHTLYRRFFPFYRCLMDLREQGVELTLFTGNHDPDPCPFIVEDLGATLCLKPTLFDIYGHRVRVEHGDQADPRHLKRYLCSLVRAPLIRGVAKSIPPAISTYIASLYSNRSFDSKPPDLPNELLSKQWLTHKSLGIQAWVFGHYHRSMAIYPSNQNQNEDQKPQKKGEVFVLGDWVRLNTLLLWDINGPQLMNFCSSQLFPLGIGDHTDKLLSTLKK